MEPLTDSTPRLSAEKRWFVRTMGFCLATGLLYGGLVAFNYWSSGKLAEILVATSGNDADIEVLHQSVSRMLYFNIALVALLGLCCLAFLVSLIQWLLAIWRRRRSQQALPTFKGFE